MMIPFLVSLYFIFEGIKESSLEGRRKYIDNSNYREYEIRKMYDGKLILIPFQNFDQNNTLAKEVFVPENRELPFKHLYFLENMSVCETESHILIECDMGIKYINRITLEQWLYFASNRASKYQQIYIQKGLSPRGLLACLGYAKADTAGHPNAGVVKEEERESRVRAEAGTGDYCRSYKYTKKVVPVKTLLMLSLGIMLAALVLGMLALLVFGQPVECAMMILCIAFLLLLMMVIAGRQGGVSLQLIQYLRDEEGNYYMVQFTKGMSEAATGVKQRYLEEDIQKAQDTAAANFYVKRFKEGYRDYDPMTGGEAKVIFLENFKLVRKGIFKSKYVYERKGRKKKIKIKNCYEGLVEELSRYQ